MAKFCGKCGAQLPDEANVCGNCGTPLAAPAQPQYQAQPQYNYAPRAPRVSGQFTGKVVDLMVKMLGIMTIVFLGLGAVGFLYEFIMGIVNAVGETVEFYGYAVGNTGSGFGGFVGGVANAIATAAKYAFYAIVTAVGAKLLKK